MKIAILRTHTSRRIGTRQYRKSELVIPPELIKELSWSPNQPITFKTVGQNRLLLIPTEQEIKPTKQNFEEFADAITNVLTQNQKGLTWTQIRQQTGLKQRTPNPTYVYKMEMEHGLQRSQDKKTQKTIWRLCDELT